MNSYRTENYIKDKVIVITGASSGFGKETAKKAAELGGKVVLAARREELLREITQEIRESGGEASYIKTDVRVKDQVNAMAKFAVDTYGRIDVLVNDAGTMPLAYYSEHAIAMEAWEQSIATAINGTLYGIAAVYDQMIEQGQGHIVNISKSKQATSRKRALEKIQLDDIRPSSRKYPYIDFRPNREIGNEVLTVDGISKTIDGVKVLDNISFIVGHDDKIAFVGGNELAKTTLFKILAGEMEPDEGSYKWGVTTSQSYFPKDNTAIFDSDELIVDWLTQYSEIKDATYVRGFLGRMLFAGEDGVKKMRVLSGGEKVRVLLSRMMIMGSNVLIFDEPTDHLDMESITALNNGMIKFPGVILFACRDHQVVQTTANRIIEFLPDGSMVDKVSTYDEYLESDVMARKRQVYNTTADEEADD